MVPYCIVHAQPDEPSETADWNRPAQPAIYPSAPSKTHALAMHAECAPAHSTAARKWRRVNRSPHSKTQHRVHHATSSEYCNWERKHNYAVLISMGPNGWLRCMVIQFQERARGLPMLRPDPSAQKCRYPPRGRYCPARANSEVAYSEYSLESGS